MSNLYIPNQFKQIGGWLALLQRYCNVSDEEADKIAEREDQIAIACTMAERYWREIEQPRVRKEVRAMREADRDTYIACRIEYLVSEKSVIQKKLNGLFDIIQKMFDTGEPLENIKKVDKMIDILERRKRSKNIELSILSGETKNDITEEMVELARNFPIAELVEVNSRGFALCVNHKDTTPSMFCRKNYAYCFTCGYQADTIRLVRDTKNLNFPQAVRMLCSAK